MSVLNLDAAKDVLETFRGKKLSDKSIETNFVNTSHAVQTTASGGRVAAVFGAGVNLAISLINEGGDIDADAIIDMGRHEDSVAFTFDKDAAWLKYALSAKCTAAASADIGTAAASVDGDRSMMLLYYKKHAKNDDLLGAIGNDAGAFLSALSVGEVKSLKAGDAVALATGGRLKASLTVTWAQIFSVSGGIVGRLARTLGASSGLIDLQAGLKVSFDVSVDDVFMLTIACIGPEQYNVVVSTAKGVQSHMGATFGITASLSAGNANQIVSSLKSGWLGIPGALLTKIEAATSMDSLSDEVRTVATELIARLDLPTGKLDDLKKRLKSFDDDCTAMLKTFAETKLALAFTYEYRRLTTQSTLVTASLNGSQLDKLHPFLLAFDIARLLDDTTLTNTRSIVMSTRQETRAWNVTLGFGNWKAGSSEKLEAKVTHRDMTTPAGRWESHSLAGNGWNRDPVVKHAIEYGLILTGEGERMTASSGAQTWKSDGAFGLWWSDNTLLPDDGDDRAEIVDNALLFGLTSEADAARFSTRLDNTSGSLVGGRFDISLTGDAMRRALGVFATATHDDWAMHAARAMVRKDKFPLLAMPSMREKRYGPFLQGYGNRPYADPGTLKRMGSTYFQDDPVYSNVMYGALVASDNPNGRYWTRWDAFAQACTHFTNLLQGSVNDWDTFQKSFNKRFVVGTQVWFIRTMASLLAERLGASLHGDPAYSVSLTLGDASKTATRIVFE